MSAKHLLMIGKSCSAIVFIIGALVIMGWYSHLTFLIQVHPLYVPMYFNSALCVVFAGAGLFAAICNKKNVSIGCGLFIGSISGVTLLQYMLNMNLGLDDLLIKPYIYSDALYPGRMTLATSWGLLITAVMLIGGGLSETLVSVLIIRISSSILLILGIVNLAGYVSGIVAKYSLNLIMPMAIQSATAFIFIGLAAVAYTWRSNILKNENLIAAWFASLVALVVLLCTFTLRGQNLEIISGMIISIVIGIAIYNTFTASFRSRQLKEKSEALSKSERRQRQIVNDLQDFAIYWLDLSGNVESWNKGAERILGYASYEIIGKNYCQFFTDEDQTNGSPQKLLELATKSKKYKGEGWMTCKNESTFWANVVVEIVKNIAGEPIGFAMITQDVTELRLLEKERSRLVATIDESADFISMADLDGHVIYLNLGAKKMVGLPLDRDLSHLKIPDMHPAWASKMVLEQALPLVLERGHWNGETALLHHQNGHEIPVLQTITLHRDEQGLPSYFTTLMRDITERKKYEEALKTSEETFRSAMEYAAIGMAIISLEGKWLKVNQSLCQIVGYIAAELLNTTFQAITHPDDLEVDLHYVTQLLAGKIITYQTEKRYIHKNGSTVWILLNVSLLRDSENQPLYFIAQIQNIETQKKAEQELKYIAYHDMLTGLSNRKHLDTAFDSALTYAKRHQTMIAVMFMDLDNFKVINDQYGHEIGDLLLVEIALRLKKSARNTDILVRLGGDEFIVAVTELKHTEQAIELAQKILSNIAKPMIIKEHDINITTSIGISIYPEDDLDLKTLIKYADQALYGVKSKGRNNFGLYSLH